MDEQPRTHASERNSRARNYTHLRNRCRRGPWRRRGALPGRPSPCSSVPLLSFSPGAFRRWIGAALLLSPLPAVTNNKAKMPDRARIYRGCLGWLCPSQSSEAVARLAIAELKQRECTPSNFNTSPHHQSSSSHARCAPSVCSANLALGLVCVVVFVETTAPTTGCLVVH
jgi:hypothetical protein